MNKGKIEKGRIADLVLPDKNPLENIRNTRDINGVIKSGKWFDKKTVDDLLKEAIALGK